MLNNKILNYKTRSHLKSNRASRKSIAYEQAQHIGLVFTIDDRAKHEYIKQFVKKLKSDDKQVTVLAYLPKDKENYEFLYDFFTAREVSFLGKFTSEAVNKFVKQPFDYLFYADQESTPVITNILAMSQAKCRIGKYTEGNHSCCEMMVQAEHDNVQELLDEMHRYTRKLA